MRTYDIAPLFRSTIGFDRLLDLLEANRTDTVWPPYNIEKVGDDRWQIAMAVAGVRPDNIEITQHDTQLVVAANRRDDGTQREYLHRGIAGRGFRQVFNLANHVRVERAGIENGMLVIDLVREVPETLKPRRIPIGGSSASVGNDNAAEALASVGKAA